MTDTAARTGTGPAGAGPAGDEPALALAAVRAGYPGADAVLRGLDLVVPPGTLVAVLGTSGCGKSTLLRVIAGFHPLDAGQVRIGGRTVAGDGIDLPPERRRVGLVPQDGSLFGHLTVAGNVGFGLARAGRRGSRVDDMLELVGLPGYGARMPAQLSGGQQQRVALARALAPAPALVLLDEPFTALDAGLRAEVRQQVLAALRAAGATAVLVTHDQQEALGSADVVAVLREGRVVQAGPPREVYSAPADLGVAGFVGDAVVLPGTAGGGRVSTPLGDLPVAGPVDDGPGRVLLRPEQLRLGLTGAPATVVQVVFHGHDTTVALDLDGHPVRSRAAGRDGAAVGDRVGVTVHGQARFFSGR